MNCSWFTSDWHLGHENQFPHRKDYTSANTVGELDQIIIDNVLSTVKKGDNLYILGDLIWKANQIILQELFNKLKRAKIDVHWINGNHDGNNNFKHQALKWRGFYKDIVINKQPIALCHYPMKVWNKSHHGAWQLFGHIHKGDHTDLLFDYSTLGKQLNVNVEFHNFMPINFDELSEIMKNKSDNFDLLKNKNDK